ncbi:MAG: ankyrin repeat domain-containing protein [Acidobacteriota bacterium]
MSDIFDAIDRADFGTVWRLVQDRSEMYRVDPETGMTPLALAASDGQSEIVRTLLGADVDLERGGIVTPLEAAVGEGDLEIVRLLLVAGAKPDSTVDGGFTPLMSASMAGDAEVARLLLEAGADPNRRNDEGDTAIDLAEAHGFDDLAAELDTFSPEALAAQRAATEERRRKEAARQRTERRRAAQAKREASPPRPKRKTPEPAPVEEPPTPTINLHEKPLVSPVAPPPKARIAPAAPIPRPRSRADASAEFDALFAGLDDLEAEAGGADPDQLTGFARYDALLRQGQGDDALAMIAAGELASDARGDDGLTLLMVAAETGALQVVDLLVAAGVEIDAEDTSDARETALVKAINQPSPDRLEIISRLAAAGANLDRQHGEAGMTPIMYAATADVYTPDPYSKVFGETTRRLAGHGARLDTTDLKGNTVWRLIKRNAMGALTSSPYRRRLFQMLRVLENLGAEQMASHEV